MVKPQVRRQLAFVFDLNKCLGCQTCTIACKTLWTDQPAMEYMWWNIVNTMPGRGTPRDRDQMGGGFDAEGHAKPGVLPSARGFGEAWEFNYDEVFYGGKGQSAYLHPSRPGSNGSGEAPDWGPNWDEDQGAGEYPNSYYFYLPTICMHCANPACLAACPRQAIFKREDDGIVLIDEDRCDGYRFCMEACPYKRIYFNPQRFISQKCVMCFARLEQGVAPACVRQCPGRVRHFGYLDDPESDVYKLVNTWKVAIRLHPEYGTEPNVYYVPPLAPPRFDEHGEIDEDNPRIPVEYLRSLFGPDVDGALATLKQEMEKARKGEKSELMDTLIAYRWQNMFIPFVNDPGELNRPTVKA
jgi:ethylbenzene hydroxylase subunit beta/complex iron-sulfur molybdoenzyme family reductase subunit beta